VRGYLRRSRLVSDRRLRRKNLNICVERQISFLFSCIVGCCVISLSFPCHPGVNSCDRWRSKMSIQNFDATILIGARRSLLESRRNLVSNAQLLGSPRCYDCLGPSQRLIIRNNIVHPEVLHLIPTGRELRHFCSWFAIRRRPKPAPFGNPLFGV